MPIYKKRNVKDSDYVVKLVNKENEVNYNVDLLSQMSIIFGEKIAKLPDNEDNFTKDLSVEDLTKIVKHIYKEYLKQNKYKYMDLFIDYKIEEWQKAKNVANSIVAIKFTNDEIDISYCGNELKFLLKECEV